MSSAAAAPRLCGPDEARALLERALAHATAGGARQAEALLDEQDTALTRFADNHIHQSVGSHRRTLLVRALVGAKSGVAATERCDAAGVAAVAARALELARLMPDDPEPLELPGPAAVPPLDGVVAATRDSDPAERAAGVAEVTAAARAAGLVAAGAFSATSAVRAVANSRGLFAHFPSTLAQFTATALADDSSGWVSAWQRDIRRLDPLALGEVAIAKARASARPGALPAGNYTVVLEPAAVAELVAFLAWIALGAQQVEEGQSCLTGRLGERVASPLVTLTDDPFDPAGAGSPFDWEGVPRRARTLIEHGVARAIVHDSATAARAGTASTGHASLPPPNPDGPMPFDLRLEPGTGTLDELVAGVDDGVLVTRFWYNRVVDPRRTLVTGMTRDGTFRIENGRVTGGVRNLRFNESVIDVLDRVLRVGGRPELAVFDYAGSAVLAPPLVVRDFQFTGVTEF